MMMMASMLCLPLGACSSGPDAPATTSEMSVSFRVETRTGEGDGGSGENTSDPDDYDNPMKYETATEWENYIDIANGDYRIGFFDNENRCITPFTPTKIEAVENSHYTEYILKGQVPGVLTLYSDFKIMVLANWKEAYPVMMAGTTIDDICCPKAGADGGNARFAHFGTGEYEVNEENGRYVPMYGIKEYKGVVFGINNEGDPTVLYEGNFGPVNMLRAIAKVELEFATTEGYTLDGSKKICITNYNDYGYCAPEGAYKESDYYHYSWEDDYRQGYLHLVGGMNILGKNILGESELEMTMLTRDGKDVWVAYLPEYRNVAATSSEQTDCTNSDRSAATVDAVSKNRAQIAVPITRNGEEYTAHIEFATHKDGEPDQYLNIERNNLYRFTVTKVDQGIKWKVVALPWNGKVHETIVM